MRDAEANTTNQAETRAHDKQSGYDFHWIFYSDRIEIGCDLGEIRAEFIQKGRCGDQDESLRTLAITEDLLTPEGRQACADAWRTRIAAQAEAEARNAEAARLKKIREIEAEQARLKGV